MAENRRPSKLVVILHADIAGSTSLVQMDEHVAHERIQETFQRFAQTIGEYHGRVRELRGDALLAEFERASDAVTAALAFQAGQVRRNAQLADQIRPSVRVGIAMGEVIVDDNTVTGAGVVLAQRVEQVSGANGVCITGAIHEALPQRLPFDQENLGERELKGFDEPVRVYSVCLRPGSEAPGPEVWATPNAAATNLPDKPSIAVLPFTNMSDSPEQEYFADGVVEDIITDLSRFKELLVIARNSSFSYKGKPIRIQQVASDLGVRYVVEGSVRRAGERLRITAQLIDAADGTHLWGERYDRGIGDVFAVQDEIVETVVGTVAARVARHGLEKLARKPTQDLMAYDYVLRARAVICDSAKNNRRCRELYETALGIDPHSAPACSGISMTYSMDYTSGWCDSPETARDRALEYALKSVALDDDDSQAHQYLGLQRLFRREYDLAEFHLGKALSLNPNNPAAWAYKGLYFIYTGQPREALLALEQATRRNPFNFSWYLWFVGLAYYSARRYREAISPLRESIGRNPNFIAPRRHLAACYAQLGQSDAAAEQTRKILELEPDFSIRSLAGTLSYRDPVDLEHYLEGLRKAGLPA